MEPYTGYVSGYASEAQNEAGYASETPSVASYMSAAPSVASYIPAVPDMASYMQGSSGMVEYMSAAPGMESYMPAAPGMMGYISEAPSVESYVSAVPSMAGYMSEAPSVASRKSNASSVARRESAGKSMRNQYSNRIIITDAPYSVTVKLYYRAKNDKNDYDMVKITANFELPGSKRNAVREVFKHYLGKLVSSNQFVNTGTVNVSPGRGKRTLIIGGYGIRGKTRKEIEDAANIAIAVLGGGTVTWLP